MSEGRRGEIVLFGSALALRLVWATDLLRNPFLAFPTGDGLFYARQAARIASGSLIGSELSYPSSPLYPYLIAPFIALPGRSGFLAIAVLQAILDAASALLVRRTASSLFGAAAGWIAGIAWAGYGTAVFFASDAVEATTATFFANLALFLLIVPARGDGAREDGGSRRRAEGASAASPRRSLFAGAWFGTAALLRPHFLVLLPLAAVLLLRGVPRRAALRGAASFGAGAALLLGLSLARNLAISGEPILVSPHSGLNAYLGNRRGANGYLTFPAGVGLRNDMDLREAARLYPEAAAGRSLSERDLSRFWWRETVREVLSDPAAWSLLMARKLRLFWSSYEAPNHLDFYFFRESSIALAIAAVPFGLIAPTALLGAGLVFAGALRGRGAIAVALLALAYSGVCAAFFIADRFRLPATGWIVILASGGVSWILRAASGGRGARAAVAGLLVAALALALRVPPPPSHGAREHVMLAAALAGRGRTGEAERMLRRAVEIDPASSVARFNLGRLLASSGREAEGEEALKEAVRLAPDFAAAHAALGDLAARSGREGADTEARRSYERALGLEPYGPEADRIRNLLSGAGGNVPGPGR